MIEDIKQNRVEQIRKQVELNTGNGLQEPALYLLSQNKALVEALVWYADEKNHIKQVLTHEDNEYHSRFELDYGETARDALTTYKGENTHD